MKRIRKIHKGTIIIVIALLFIVAGIAFLVYSFLEMRSYQKFLLVMAYDMESPEVHNRVKYEEQNVVVMPQNLKSVEYYLSNEVHKPWLFGVKKGECIEIQFIRGNGAISNVKIYETDSEYLYLEYRSEQGEWDYYIGGYDGYAQIKQAVSPQGKNEPNTILKH